MESLWERKGIRSHAPSRGQLNIISLPAVAGARDGQLTFPAICRAVYQIPESESANSLFCISLLPLDLHEYVCGDMFPFCGDEVAEGGERGAQIEQARCGDPAQVAEQGMRGGYYGRRGEWGSLNAIVSLVVNVQDSGQ